MDDALVISGKEGQAANLTIKIPEVYLTSGAYKFDIVVEKFNDVYDCLFNCISLNILQGERIKRNYVIPQEIRTFIPTKWEIISF